MRHIIASCAATALAAAMPAVAEETRALGANLEDFDYAQPVRWFSAQAQGGEVRMAYLDVAPAGWANGRTAVLLHGKNFCAGTWESTIAALSAAGWRIIAPDQVGFCKSGKPTGFQYSFHAMAALTDGLLRQAGVDRVALVGHSTGGMLAIRHALLYPDRVEQLVLVNPLGLNDTLAEGVPYTPLDALRAEEAKTDAASIRAYQQRVYYGGQWRPEYERWVAMLAGQYASPGGAAVREAQARTSDMIQTQPTGHELGRIAVPVTLLVGQKDLTAFRSASAPESVRDKVRAVPAAAESAVRIIPQATLIRFEDLGHSPQVEDASRFEAALIAALAAPR